jgi:hypothetical protein
VLLMRGIINERCTHGDVILGRATLSPYSNVLQWVVVAVNVGRETSDE